MKPAIVRDRLRRARRLAGMTATEAWQKMGYKNAAQLSKMESETSTSSINYNFVIRAAMCYKVSTDYLLGLSNYDDCDPQLLEQKAILNGLEDLSHNLSEQLTELLLKGGQEITLKSHLEAVIQQADNVIQSFERIRASNPTFDDEIRGGAKVVKEVEVLKGIVDRSQDKLRRLRYSPTVLKQFKAIKEEELRQAEFDVLRNE